MVIFDANFLLLLLDPDVDVPLDPRTKAPLVKPKERIDLLIAVLSKQRETIGIPTPVIAEVLVGAKDAGPKYLGLITGSSRFLVLPFDLRAAIETAALTANALAAGDKKAGSAAPWQKVKVDRQIVATGVSRNVTTIYSDDSGVLKLAQATRVPTISSWELPLPPEDPQASFDV